MNYDWLRAFHIIGIVTWFAGLFYIFRLYVYHVENQEKPEICALLEVMERRLYKAICWPAMIFTTVFGLLLWSRLPIFYLYQVWFQIKLVALLGVFFYHFYAGKVGRDLAIKHFKLNSRQCRMINEVPTVLLLLIVIMAVVKPIFG